jgi:hypothetical protein
VISDYIFMVGVVMAAFALPSYLNAWTEGRFPRSALSCVIFSGVCLTVAQQIHPVGYRAAEVPEVFVRVLGQFVN